MTSFAILQFNATANFNAAFSTALLNTGFAPGCPMHVGQQFVFGSGLVGNLHPQNIFVLIPLFREMCTSSPILILFIEVK